MDDGNFTLAVRGGVVGGQPVMVTEVACRSCTGHLKVVEKKVSRLRMSPARQAAVAAETARRLLDVMRRREYHHVDCPLWRG